MGVVRVLHGGEAPAFPFFAYCIDTHDSAKRSLQEQAALLRRVGGMTGWDIYGWTM